MQPSPWDDLQTEGSAPQVMIDGQTAQISTGFNNQVILLQPPSSAAKVIGILLIIWGAINAIFLLLAAVGWSSSEIREEQGITTSNIILNSVSGIISVATSILGGIWMMNFQRKGVSGPPSPGIAPICMGRYVMICNLDEKVTGLSTSGSRVRP